MQKRLHDILQAKIKSVKPTLNLRGLKLKRVRNRKREQMVEGRAAARCTGLSACVRIGAIPPVHTQLSCLRLCRARARVPDRNIQIDQENKKLLRRMEEIALTPQVDCHLRRRHAQTNYGHRKLHVDAVNRENLVRIRCSRLQTPVLHSQCRGPPCLCLIHLPLLYCDDAQLMLKRLQGTRSVYNSAKWEEEREDMLRRIRYMSEYKEDGKPKFFQFGFEPPDDANKSKSGGTGGSRSRSSSRASRGSRTKRSKSGGTRGRRRRRKGSDRDALAHTAPQRAMTAGALGSRAKAEWGGTPEHSKSAVMLPRIATTSHGASCGAARRRRCLCALARR